MKVINLKGNNKVIEGSNVIYDKAKITFQGKNNILFLEGNINLGESKFLYHGNNSLAFFRSNYDVIKIPWLDIHNDSVFHMGLNTSHGQIQIFLGEHKNIFIGNDNMFSTDICIRNSDGHLVYSSETKERINYSRSTFIGDHVWIGQNVIILKGTQIHSGSIIGAGSIVTGKKIPSNTSWAGNPAKQISKDVFWHREYIHPWREEDTEKFFKMETDEYIFEHDKNVYIPFDDIDKQLDNCKSTDEKLNYLIKYSSNTNKNRFAF